MKLSSVLHGVTIMCLAPFEGRGCLWLSANRTQAGYLNQPAVEIAIVAYIVLICGTEMDQKV